MNRWSGSFLRVTFAFVIVFLAGVVSFSVRAAFHSQSDRIAGITFLVAVVCLVLAFEKVFPSVYSGSTRRSPWLQSRAGLAVAIVIFGIIISVLSSRVATIWFGLTIIGSAFVALLLRASRRDEEL
jgi:divalent metal cation (Fe/Co/Zn/Cd) transporter